MIKTSNDIFTELREQVSLEDYSIKKSVDAFMKQWISLEDFLEFEKSLKEEGLHQHKPISVYKYDKLRNILTEL